MLNDELRYPFGMILILHRTTPVGADDLGGPSGTASGRRAEFVAPYRGSASGMFLNLVGATTRGRPYEVQIRPRSGHLNSAFIIQHSAFYLQLKSTICRFPFRNTSMAAFVRASSKVSRASSSRMGAWAGSSRSVMARRRDSQI